MLRISIFLSLFFLLLIYNWLQLEDVLREEKHREGEKSGRRNRLFLNMTSGKISSTLLFDSAWPQQFKLNRHKWNAITPQRKELKKHGCDSWAPRAPRLCEHTYCYYYYQFYDTSSLNSFRTDAFLLPRNIKIIKEDAYETLKNSWTTKIYRLKLLKCAVSLSAAIITDFFCAQNWLCVPQKKKKRWLTSH